MIEPNDDFLFAQIVALLSHYQFELSGYTAEELVAQWLKTHPADWVRLAVIEALYQGRYKAVSVEQILSFWTRRQQPASHFNHDFERLICRKLPQNFAATSEPPSAQNQFSQPPEETTEVEIKSQPKVAVNPQPPHVPDWDRSGGKVGQRPIHQFTPPPDSSEFYLKLKAVAQQSVEEEQK